MKVGGVVAESWKSLLRAVVAAGLCVLLVDLPLIAAAAVVKKPVAGSKGQIQGDERVLHALNRLTFGPRPGDLEAVKAMGLQRWFDAQLNPSKIDDSALQARLEMFPAMQLKQEELIRRYPNGQMLKKIIDDHAMLPRDPVEHAIYTDLIAYYKDGQQAKKAAAPAAAGDSDMQASADMKKGAAALNDADSMSGDASSAGSDSAMTAPAGKKKNDRPKVNFLGPGGGKKQADSPAMNGALPGDGVDPAAPGMKEHEEQFYSGQAAIKIINLPPDERMDRILSMKPDELVDFRKSLSRNELVEFRDGLNPQQLEILGALQGSAKMVGGELLQSRLMHDLYSDRQLEAVMTDFWLNHFNIYLKKNQNEPYLLPEFERDVVRPRALGKFEDLLVATARSPAMLMYLDNQQSIGPQSRAALNNGRYGGKQAKDRGLNENYARELMELHTLGVQCEVSMDHPMSALDRSCGRGYSQQDVTQVALVLTGWTLDRPQEGGQFTFEPRRHQPGTKLVMGKQYMESGEAEGAMVLHELATSPATAKFISTKLAVRFVSDTPPPALVDKMSAAFLSSGGDMKAVLRAMFDAPEFWSPEVYRAKVKTPLEFVTSAVRASGADVTNAQPLVQSLEKLGMPLYGMQTPNGYSWTSEHWVNTGDLVNRMNFSLVLAGNRMNGVQTDWTQILGGAAGAGLMQPVSMSDNEDSASVAAKEKKLEFALMGHPVSEKTRATVMAQADNMGAQQEAEKNFALRLADPNHALPPEAAMAGGHAKQGIKMQAKQRDSQTAVMAGLLLGSPEFQRR
jgi:uncharacterized protein (DUF1800 family)